MPHFDATITLGSILSVVSVVGAGLVFFVRMGEIQRTQSDLIAELKRDFASHEARDDIRFERLEGRIIDLVSGLQRLVGRAEVPFRTRDRNQS